MKRRQENLEYYEVIGSLTSATTAATFDSPSNWKWTWLLSYGVKSGSSFWHHPRCIAGKTSDFPSLKLNTSQELFLRLLMMTGACGRRTGLMDIIANQD